MPGSLLTMFLGWLATHLVALSALVFLAAGLVLSGHVSLPGWPSMAQSYHPPIAAGAESPTDSSAAEARPAPARQPAPAAIQAEESAERHRVPMLSGSPAIDKVPPATEVRDAGRGQPLMIGGTIPVYGNPRQADAGGFRPPAATPSPAPVVQGYEGLLQQARRAFWNGDFEAAEHTYMDVIERYPDDADVYGELGNLYVAMGKNALALDAYFEAGVRLKALGEQQRVMEVAEILNKKGDDRGQQLSANR
jgi:hypothetical protein